MPALKDSTKVDVIVVGAGPSGLVLASELRLFGVSVVVLEKLPEPTGQSRGLGFSAVTTSIFDQRGVLSRFGPIEVGTDAGSARPAEHPVSTPESTDRKMRKTSCTAH
jgi:2-polyprenyl-6-methoxyphenol hydroxylase-like FAD-dependent oxidoreductase